MNNSPHIELYIASVYNGFVPRLFEKFFTPKLDAISRQFGVSGTLILKKGVPLGAGVGGSSTAIVATIKCIEKYFETIKRPRPASKNFLLSLSSDAPCVYEGGFLRVRGVGDDISRLAPCALPDFDVLIPPLSSNSAACYAKYDSLLAEGKIRENSAVPATVSEALSSLRNDLTLPATLLYPDLAAFRASLLSKYPRVLMSGSGSAFICFK